jgi:hypothetical protein
MKGWVIASAGPSLIDRTEFEQCDLSGLHPDTAVHSCIFRDCRLPSSEIRLEDCLTEVSG